MNLLKNKNDKVSVIVLGKGNYKDLNKCNEDLKKCNEEKIFYMGFGFSDYFIFYRK